MVNVAVDFKMPKKSFIIFFFIIILGFFYLINFVIYRILGLMFNIILPIELFFLALVLGVFSGSFFLASIIGNYYYNFFTRFYYKISAIWIGFFLYLFFACILYLIIVLILGQILMLIGILLLFLAGIISLYGIFHSKKIYISKLQIELANLPISWQNRKIVWISDLHLGQLLGFSFVEKIVKEIEKLSPDIIFIGGDLFDGTKAPDLSKLINPFSKINVPLGIYFITGNHEEFGKNDEFIFSLKKIGIKTLVNEMIEIDDIQFLGVDYKSTFKRKEFEEIFSNFSISMKMPTILLKHEPKDLDIAEKAGIFLQISGHTHQAQMWPLNYIASLVYKGYDYGLKKFGKMQVYISSGIGTWGPPMRIGTKSEIVLINFLKN